MRAQERRQHVFVVPLTNCAILCALAAPWEKGSLSWNNDGLFSSACCPADIATHGLLAQCVREKQSLYPISFSVVSILTEPVPNNKLTIPAQGFDIRFEQRIHGLNEQASDPTDDAETCACE
jgi:hypothetical protein